MQFILPRSLYYRASEFLNDFHITAEGDERAECPNCRKDLKVEQEESVAVLTCSGEFRGCTAIQIQHGLWRAGCKVFGPPPQPDEIIEIAPLGMMPAIVGQVPDHIVEGLLPDRMLLLLTGKSKSGKSLLALDMLHAISTGSPVFGELKVNRPGHVIYLAMEDGPLELSRRVVARGIDMGSNNRLLGGTNRCLVSEPAGITQLYTIARQFKPVLICIDTAREALGIKDWADTAEVAEKIRPLRLFARDNCTVVLVSHNRKTGGNAGDEISGSTALTSSVDGWLSCHRHRTEGDDTLRLTIQRHGRGGMHGETTVQMDPATYRFNIYRPEPALEDLPMDRKERRMNEALACLPPEGATADHVATALKVSTRNAQYILRELEQQGLITDTGERRGRNSTAIVYSLTTAGARETPNSASSPSS